MKNKGCGVWGLFVGSNANNSANAGFAYFNSNNAPSNSNSNIGSRLNYVYKKLTIITPGLATWQKIKNKMRALVAKAKKTEDIAHL